MPDEKTIQKMQVLECFSVYYEPQEQEVREYWNEILNDNKNFLKSFLQYAFGGRAGAPKSFSLVGVHLLEEYYNKENTALKVWEEFKKIFEVKKKDKKTGETKKVGTNKDRNPLRKETDEDVSILDLELSKIFTPLKNGNIEEVYKELVNSNIKGIGAKIVMFFLRDVVAFCSEIKKSEWGIKEYCFVQPIDRWLRLVGKELNLSCEPPQDISDNLIKVEQKDKNVIYGICKTCLTNKICPLKFNQGTWYFCSQIVGADKYLEKILKEQPTALIKVAERFHPVIQKTKLERKLKEKGFLNFLQNIN